MAVGGPALLEQAGAGELPVADQWRRDGAIILHVLVDGRVAGALALADEVRAESRSAVDQLRERGVEVVMITGDAQAVAASVADQLGITRFFAGVRPRTSRPPSPRCRTRDVGWRWSATASTTHPPSPGRRRHRHRGRHRRRHRLRRHRAGQRGPPVRRLGHRPVRSHLPQEHAEPGLGRGLQPHLRPPRRRGARPRRLRHAMSAGALLMSASTVVVALNAQLLRRLDLRPAAPTTKPRTVSRSARNGMTTPSEYRNPDLPAAGARTIRTGRRRRGSPSTAANRPGPARHLVSGARYADGSGGPGPCAGDGGPAR